MIALSYFPATQTENWGFGHEARTNLATKNLQKYDIQPNPRTQRTSIFFKGLTLQFMGPIIQNKGAPFGFNRIALSY